MRYPPSTPNPATPSSATPGRRAGISPEALAEFRRLCKQEYGRDLSPEEATVAAGRLIELFRILLRPPR